MLDLRIRSFLTIINCSVLNRTTYFCCCASSQCVSTNCYSVKRISNKLHMYIWFVVRANLRISINIYIYTHTHVKSQIYTIPEGRRERCRSKVFFKIFFIRAGRRRTHICQLIGWKRIYLTDHFESPFRSYTTHANTILHLWNYTLTTCTIIIDHTRGQVCLLRLTFKSVRLVRVDQLRAVCLLFLEHLRLFFRLTGVLITL